MRSFNNIEVQAVKARPIHRRHRQLFVMPLPRNETLAKIFKAAMDVFDLTKNELVMNTHQHYIARPRMCMAHLIRLELCALKKGSHYGAMTAKEVAALFGRTDHTFCIYASKCVNNAIAGYDPELLEKWNLLTTKYNEL